MELCRAAKIAPLKVVRDFADAIQASGAIAEQRIPASLRPQPVVARPKPKPKPVAAPEPAPSFDDVEMDDASDPEVAEEVAPKKNPTKGKSRARVESSPDPEWVDEPEAGGKRVLQDSPSRVESAAKRTRVAGKTVPGSQEKAAYDFSEMTFPEDTPVDFDLFPPVAGLVSAGSSMGLRDCSNEGPGLREVSLFAKGRLPARLGIQAQGSGHTVRELFGQQVPLLLLGHQVGNRGLADNYKDGGRECSSGAGQREEKGVEPSEGG